MKITFETDSDINMDSEENAKDSYTKLKEIVDGIDDITDPEGMEKLLEHFDDITKEDEEFMRLLGEKLSSESVYWEQPWYQQHGKISRNPKFEEIDESNMYLTNTICQEERERIEKNWKKLIKKYDIPDKLDSLCRWKNVTCDKKKSEPELARRFVVAYLARGLKRNLYQVLRHIIAYYGTIPKGTRYQEVENKVVEMALYHMPKRCARIACVLLGRELRHVYVKLHLLKGKEKTPKKRVKWTLTLASKLLRKMLKHSGLSLEELKYRKLEKSVWLKLEKSMKHSYIYLQLFWYSSLHVQLFVDRDIKMYRLKKTILKKIRAKNYKLWGDIRWTEIAEDLPDGITNKFVYVQIHRILRSYPNYRKRPIEELLIYAFEKIKYLKKKNKRLKRLKFCDGKLEKIVNDC